jgi:hypothetical protein
MLSAYNVILIDGDYSYPDLQYWDEYESFEIDEIVIDEELLKAIQSKKLKIQRDYTNSLQDFQNEINSQATLQIPVLNEYNPINITQIITRCLELSVGTVENGLTYTTEAGLIAETARLNKIKTLVKQVWSSKQKSVDLDMPSSGDLSLDDNALPILVKFPELKQVLIDLDV